MTTVDNLLEHYATGGGYSTPEGWRDQLLQTAANHGFRYALLAIFASHDTPIELRNAYVQTNVPEDFLGWYDDEEFGDIDPVALHCMARSTPLHWSRESFSGERQVKLYAEMRRVGMQAGVALPYHGPCGEFGMLYFSGDQRPLCRPRQAAPRNITELTYFRDVAMEVFSGFMRKGHALRHENIEITSRELECLKWCAAGKSSWDIAHLMNCTEATVNYHFANIRRKFGASSRRMAVIKAIQLGFLSV
jgi:LuxR family quorum-sensing transcriptional regulator LasR